jgi:hypothetical protein
MDAVDGDWETRLAQLWTQLDESSQDEFLGQVETSTTIP